MLVAQSPLDLLERGLEVGVGGEAQAEHDLGLAQGDQYALVQLEEHELVGVADGEGALPSGGAGPAFQRTG